MLIFILSLYIGHKPLLEFDVPGEDVIIEYSLKTNIENELLSIVKKELEKKGKGYIYKDLVQGNVKELSSKTSTMSIDSKNLLMGIGFYKKGSIRPSYMRLMDVLKSRANSNYKMLAACFIFLARWDDKEGFWDYAFTAFEYSESKDSYPALLLSYLIFSNKKDISEAREILDKIDVNKLLPRGRFYYKVLDNYYKKKLGLMKEYNRKDKDLLLWKNFLEGVEQFRKKNYRSAFYSLFSIIENTKNIEPSFYFDLMFLIMFYSAINNVENMVPPVEYMEKYIIKKRIGEIWYEKLVHAIGDYYYAIGDYEKARYYYRILMVKDAYLYYVAMISMAWIDAEESRFSSALVKSKEVLEKSSNPYAVILGGYICGVSHYGMENYKEAVPYLKVKNVVNDGVEPFYKKMEKKINFPLEKEPVVENLMDDNLYFLGRCYENMGKYDNAVRVYTSFILGYGHSERMKQVLYRLFVVKTEKTGELSVKEAMKRYIIPYIPAYGTIWKEYLMALLKVSDLSLYPGEYKTKEEIEYYLKEKNTSESIKNIIREIKEVNSNSPLLSPLTLQLVKKLDEEKKYEELLALLDTTKIRGVYREDMNLYKVKALFYTGKCKKGVKIISKERIISMPFYIEFLYLAGECFYNTGNRGKAKKIANLLLKQYSRHPIVFYHREEIMKWK